MILSVTLCQPGKLGQYTDQATGWTSEESRKEIFLFYTGSRLATGLSQPPNKQVLGAPSLRVKWPWNEADHKPASNGNVTNSWSYIATSPHTFITWCLIKHSDDHIGPLIMEERISELYMEFICNAMFNEFLFNYSYKHQICLNKMLL